MLNYIKKNSEAFYLKLFFIGGNIFIPILVLAQEGGGGGYRVENPLGPNIDTLPELITLILNVVVQIGVPVVALGIIYSGFLFVKAQGNQAELKTAKETFFWTVIGSLIVLGAFVIATIIQGTIDQLK